MIEQSLLSAGIALVSALIGGLAGYLGAQHAVGKQLQALENQELRRLRIDCLVKIAGLRFLLGDPSRREYTSAVAAFNEAINRALVLFANEKEVRKALANYRASPEAARLLACIRQMAIATQIEIGDLSDDDLTSVLRLAVADPQTGKPA